MLVMVFGTPILFSSCSSDEDNNDASVVDGIDTSLLPGIYDFNGNIAPDFTLYKDGTCDVDGNTSTKGKWTYNKSTHVLLVDTHVYTIKLLTKESLVAEWTSVKYGTSVSSWERRDLAN